MATVGEEDFSSTRVPTSEQKHWFAIAVTKFGQVSALSQFLLGSTLGFGMTFWNAFWAITFGSVILQVVSILVGIIGQREGLTTSILTRWTGFGRGGSAIVGFVVAISSIGWFGIQSAVSAQGLVNTIGGLSFEAWAIIFGLVITVIVLYGFKLIAGVAYVAVPAFLVLCIFSIGIELSRHSITELMQSPPPGDPLTLMEGVALVAGGFIVGAVINSDITRYNRSTADVIKQTIVGISGGEYLIGLIGVLLAHATGSNDVTVIILSSVGWVGVLIIIMGTIKINDVNLYAASFGFVNLLNTVFRRPIDRRIVTIVIGIIGSILGAIGILDYFTNFLIFLGVLLPPVAAIMIAEYFVIKAWRSELDDSRDSGLLPAEEPIWVPATLVIWAISVVAGMYIPWGIGAINSLIVAFILYVAAGKAGLVREYGRGATIERQEQ